MSAKVRVPFLRQVVPISKKVREGQEQHFLKRGRLDKLFVFFLLFPKVARDPRFDDLSGEYNPEIFDKTYQFLNDIRAKEKEVCNMKLVCLLLEGELEYRLDSQEEERGRILVADLFAGSWFINFVTVWSSCLLPFASVFK